MVVLRKFVNFAKLCFSQFKFLQARSVCIFPLRYQWNGGDVKNTLHRTVSYVLRDCCYPHLGKFHMFNSIPEIPNIQE